MILPKNYKKMKKINQKTVKYAVFLKTLAQVYPQISQNDENLYFSKDASVWNEIWSLFGQFWPKNAVFDGFLVHPGFFFKGTGLPQI